MEGREEEKSAGEKKSKRKTRPRGARRHDRVEKGAVVKDIEEDSKLTSAVKPDDPGRAETSFGFWASSSRALATWDAEWGGMAADCT